jgi:DNA-binding MarR family transcriptional regulator
MSTGAEATSRAMSPPSPGRDVRRLRAAVRALVHRFSISERADVACCGVTVAQAAALEALSPDSIGLGELGRRLGIAPSTLSRNLDRLEERGLVRRAAQPGDGRAASAELTETGRRAARRLERQEDAFAGAVLALLPGERRRDVLRSLEELLAAVRQATAACCPGAFDHLTPDVPGSGSRARREP